VGQWANTIRVSIIILYQQQ